MMLIDMLKEEDYSRRPWFGYDHGDRNDHANDNDNDPEDDDDHHHDHDSDHDYVHDHDHDHDHDTDVDHDNKLTYLLIPSDIF